MYKIVEVGFFSSDFTIIAEPGIKTHKTYFYSYLIFQEIS